MCIGKDGELLQGIGHVCLVSKLPMHKLIRAVYVVCSARRPSFALLYFLKPR
jgi:hypothetical protein